MNQLRMAASELVASAVMAAALCWPAATHAAKEGPATGMITQQETLSEPALAAELQRVAGLRTHEQRAKALPELRNLWTRAQAELGADSPLALRVLYSLVVLETQLLELDSAIRNGEECLARRRAVLGDTHDETIEISAQLGVTYAEAGQNSRARELLQSALARAEGRRKPPDELLLGILDDFGALLSRLDDLPGSLRLGYRAFEGWTAHSGPAHAWTIFSAANLVHALTRAGRLEEAIAVSRRAIGGLTEADRAKPTAALVRLYNNFGAALYASEQREESAVYIGLAARAAESIWGPKHFFTMQMRANGITHGAFGGGRVRLTQLQELAASCDASLGAQHAACGSVRLHLAKAHIELGTPQQAIPLLQALVESRQRTEPAGSLPLIQARQALALALTRAGGHDEALKVVDRVIEQTDRLRLMFGTTGPDRQGALQAHLPSYQLRLLNHVHVRQSDAALVASESIKAQRLAERLGLRTLLEAQDASPEQRANLSQRLEAVAEADRKLSVATRRGADAAALDAVRSERLAAMDAVLAAFRAGSEGSRAWAHVQAQSEPQVRASAQALATGELFISYHLLPDDGVLAVVADRTGPLAGHDLGRIHGLAQLVSALRVSAASPAGARLAVDATGAAVEVVRWTTRSGDTAWGVAASGLEPCAVPRVSDKDATGMPAEPVDPWWPGATARPTFLALPCRPVGSVSVQPHQAWPAISRQLAARLVTTVIPKGVYSKLVISPDGPLWALPWELLLREAPRSPQAVALVHSLGHLAQVRERRLRMAAAERAPRLLALGDPAYTAAAEPHATRRGSGLRAGRLPAQGPGAQGPEQAQRPQWPRLPFSRQEVQRIAAGFGAERATVLSGAEASEEALRRLAKDGGLSGFTHLVFSVHGYFDPDLPDGAGIVLTATGDSADKDGYVTASDIGAMPLRSRLTLLSACNTARGDRDFVEGQTGLSYALAWAGSDATVAALWPVSDRGAAAFSVRLVELVRQGSSPARALATVKREFQRSSDPVLSSPALWAAFVLHGD